MPLTQWEMQGWEVVNCSCNWGCPCQFNQLPSHGYCTAYLFTHIERGHFGDVRLDGLRWGLLCTWPGAIHQGRGTAQVVVDERADPKQRAAMEAVAMGKETEPMKVVWSVFAAMTTKFLPTIVAPIDLEANFESRIAKVRVPGVLTGDLSPITNATTGAESRVRVVLPNGFEFIEAEFASGTGQSPGEIPIDFNRSHAHLAHVHWNTQGVVRPSA